MRILLSVIAVAAVALVGGVVALALLLPRVLASVAVREQIQTAAKGALGCGVGYAELDFGLFPPSLLALDVAVAFAQAPPLRRLRLAAQDLRVPEDTDLRRLATRPGEKSGLGDLVRMQAKPLARILW